jgi:hypothetical protein
MMGNNIQDPAKPKEKKPLRILFIVILVLFAVGFVNSVLNSDPPPIKESTQKGDSAMDNGLHIGRILDGEEELYNRADYRSFAASRSAAVAGHAG